MKRVSKAILIILGVLVMLVAGAIYSVNRYLQSPAARERLEAEFSHAIGLPLRITSLHAGWGGAKVSGVRIPSDAGQPNLLEADSFSASFAMLPLLSRRLEVARITLESPKMVWAQNEEGKWILPFLPEKGSKQKLPNGDQPKPADSSSSKSVSVALDRLQIHHGTLELIGDKGQHVLVATDLEIDQSLKDPKNIHGTISAGRLAWSGLVAFTNVRSPLTYSNGELKLTDLKGQNGDGTVQGTATIQTEAKDTPFTVNLQLDRVELGHLAADAGWPANLVTGYAGGTFEMSGFFSESAKNRGKGSVTLSNCHIAQMDLFSTIGQILQIPELSDLKVKTGRADFHFGDDKTYLDSVQLETPDLRIVTKGNIRYDGKLNLAAELGVSERVARQLPSIVRSNFSAPDAKQLQTIAFTVTGMSDRPTTDLLNRVIGQQLGNQFDDLVASIFGGGKKEDKPKDKDKDKEEKKRKKEEKEKKKAEAEAAAAAAAAGGASTPPAPVPNPALNTPPAPQPQNP